ncbi:hypothetical protein F4810DRAFT_705866 [Camillea tinctor]|nr:hypothetical protein F4810DRAFT_705866 [Camillea tinctor]
MIPYSSSSIASPSPSTTTPTPTPTSNPTSSSTSTSTSTAYQQHPTPTITAATPTPTPTPTSATTAIPATIHPPSSSAAAQPPRSASPHKRGLSPNHNPDDQHSPADSTSASASASPSQIQTQTRHAAPPEDQRTRKRRAAGPAGSARGVANLTPEQLAKKRANDREAQRAIRERTRNQIETLEKRIQELTSQQPYQELQAVIRQKEAVEAENAEIRGRLASIMALIQPVLSGQQAQPSFASPTPTFIPNHPAAVPPALPPPFPAASAPPPTPQNLATPSSATSPVSTADSPLHHSHTPAQSSPGLKQVMLLSQQRQELYHGLDVSSTGEQLKLDFLLGPTTAGHHHISRIRTGVDGPQDSPAYQHLPMKHDWNGASLPPRHMAAVTAASRQYIHHSNSNSGDSNSGNTGHHDHSHSGGSGNHNYNIHHPHHHHHPHSLGHEPTNPPLPLPPPPPWTDYSTPFNNCAPTCPLDSLLLDFLRERRQRGADGWGAREVLGPRYPSVSSLLNPSRSAYAHPLSKVFTDVLSTFPGLYTLPERVAVLYVMFLAMRWQVDPSSQNYDRMPSWIRPTEAQRRVKHPAWQDYIPFPEMRDKLVAKREEDERERERERQRRGGAGGGEGEKKDTYLFEDFFIPFTGTVRVGWPYTDEDALLLSPDGDEVLINPVFERHLRRLENWSLGPEFHRAFPELEGTYRLNGNTDGG